MGLRFEYEFEFEFEFEFGFALRFWDWDCVFGVTRLEDPLAKADTEH